MATSSLVRPVLPGNPAANCDAYIIGLLDELRQRFDRIPVVPGASVSLPSSELQDLRGTFIEASIAVRNKIKWTA